MIYIIPFWYSKVPFCHPRYAYACANYAARLSVVDVSDPSSPSILASTEYDAANLVMCEGVAVDGR